jgi:hypothetical protein
MKVIGQPVLVVVADRGLQFSDEGGYRVERLCTCLAERRGQQQGKDNRGAQVFGHDFRLDASWCRPC